VEIVLQRNDQYYGKPAHYDTVPRVASRLLTGALDSWAD
jgi:hypothetical protein